MVDQNLVAKEVMEITIKENAVALVVSQADKKVEGALVHIAGKGAALIADIVSRKAMVVIQDRTVDMALVVELEVDKDLEAERVNKAVGKGLEVKVVKVVTLVATKVG